MRKGRGDVMYRLTILHLTGHSQVATHVYVNIRQYNEVKWYMKVIWVSTLPCSTTSNGVKKGGEDVYCITFLHFTRTLHVTQKCICKYIMYMAKIVCHILTNPYQLGVMQKIHNWKLKRGGCLTEQCPIPFF